MIVDGQCSEYGNVIPGVLQGDVLGPLLFILYITDVMSSLENRLVAYADDVTLFASVPSALMRSVVA